MSWNYRIVKIKSLNADDGDYYELHEVFYDEMGLPWGMTERAVGFGANEDDGPSAVIDSLMMALSDARKHPVLDHPGDHWPGKAP